MVKKSLRLILAVFVIIGGMAIATFAQEGNNHKPKSINERQEAQRDRIKDGVQDGDISKKELARLAREQQQIRQQERRFKSDGDFTKAERARVQRNLNQASRHIGRANRH